MGRNISKENSWDRIAERFNTHKNKKEIHPDAAVNLYIGWPVFFGQIRKHSKFLGKRSCEILEFGCGAGSFCEELNRRGHKVIGMDPSKKMLEIARNNLSRGIKLMNEQQYKRFLKDKSNHNSFDIITSIHSLDWIENIGDTIDGFAKLLKHNGIIVFGVFPKNHVIDSLVINDLFEDFDSKTNPKTGYANFDGIRIPVFVREAKFYDRMLKKKKFEKVLETYPPYPKAFLRKFNWTGSKYPEMMIMAYRKDHFTS